MELPIDITQHIKDYSMPLPNSKYTVGMTDQEIAQDYAYSWIEQHLIPGPDIQITYSFNDGCRIIIMNNDNLRLNARFSIAHLREWDGNIGTRYVQIINY